MLFFSFLASVTLCFFIRFINCYIFFQREKFLNDNFSKMINTTNPNECNYIYMVLTNFEKENKKNIENLEIARENCFIKIMQQKLLDFVRLRNKTRFEYQLLCDEFIILQKKEKYYKNDWDQLKIKLDQLNPTNIQ